MTRTIAAILSGIEITRTNPAGIANPTVDLAYSPDGGSTWLAIASGVSMDRFGRGGYAWTVPANAATGIDYLFQVTSDQMPTVKGVSSAPFSVANSGNLYYVNDGSTSGDVYKTAVGNNANDGKTPATPMASLGALLSAYVMHPGDVVYVDSGNYQVVRNIVLGPNDSGITIQGPGATDVTLNRGNTNTGSYVFELDGATNVTIDGLGITGGYQGIHGDYGTVSTGLSVTNSTIFGNANTGADLESQSGGGNFDGASFTGDTFYGVAGDQSTGLLLNYVNNATVSGNVAYNSQYYGIEVYASRNLINGNTVYGDGTGIYVGNNSSDPADLNTVSNNIVRENTSSGIYVNTNTLVTGNFVYNNTSATGIVAYSAAVTNNSIHDNATGILSYYGSTITGNRVFHHTGTGIDAYGSPNIQGNDVYANSVGILGDTYSYGYYYGNFSGTITNNLVYDNSSDGIILTEAGGAHVLSNTVYQTTGDAIVLENSSENISLLNNILWTQNGYDLNVHPDSEVGLSSDFNDLYFTAAGHIGLWEGLAFTALDDWFYELGLDTHSLDVDPKFINPAGPDGLLGFNDQVKGSPIILDDSSPTGVSFSGNWSTQDTGGYNGESAVSDSTNGDSATYSFTGLTPGSYEQVAITWPATPNASHTLLYVLDGDQVLSSFVVDQTQGPNGSGDPSSPWLSLGTYYVSGDTLKVEIVYENSYYNYNYTAVADAVSIQPIAGDVGPDDNFHVQTSSPTIDAGNPTSLSFNEPLPNGGRINLGFDGNTPQAATSPAQLIQVLSPNGLEKYVQGQQVNLQWQSDGLTQLQNVLDINAGNGPAIGDFQANMDQVDANYYANGSFKSPVDVSGVDNPAPQAVYQSYAAAPAGIGNTLSYRLPVPDGTYTIRLDFADDSAYYEGQRVFDVNLQGTTVQAGYDIFQAAGDVADRATQLTFTVTASGGNGIALDLVNDTYNPAILSGIEVTRTNPAGNANPTVDLTYSPDGGSTWLAIASGVSMDRFGRGGYAWTVPANAATGIDYLFQVTSDQMPTVKGVSSAPFSVANSGNLYYVNDGSTSGDVYKTAVGNNANDGKTPATPMASLGALLSAYVMHPGDVVYVNSGNYQVVRNIVLGPNDSGITIEGPGAADVTLDRGNTNTGSYVFELDGATNVTITGLGVTGGAYGLYGDYGSGSTGLTVTNSSFFANANTGADLEYSNDHATFLDDAFFGITTTPQPNGLALNNVNDSEVTGNVAHDSSNTGISVNGLRDSIVGNQAHDDGTGISVSANSSGPADLTTLIDNVVRENSSYGITAYGDVLVTKNTVFDNVTGDGILVDNATATDNEVYGNVIGIYTSTSSSTITGNRVYNNSGSGIYAYLNTTISGNYVYSNGVGIQTAYTPYGGGFSGTVSDNLVYANVDGGIELVGASGALVVNNTVYELVGDAVGVAGGSQNVRIENNILWVESGYDIDVSGDSQSGLASDYNLFNKGIDPNAHVGYYGGIQDTFAQWQAIGQDGNSVAGDPNFVDINGADNVLGYTTANGGYDGGKDDNFYTLLSSLPIDRGDPWYAPATDIAGNPRVDDPGTPNTGRPDYFESPLSSAGLAQTGIAMGWNGYATSWTLNLPFAFPFSDGSYTQVDVSSSGYLQLGGGPNDNGFNNSDGNLAAYRRIAPLWAAIRTDLQGDDIYVDTSTKDQITIRWQGSEVQDGSPVNFAVTLFSSGNIRFDYGDGNANLAPTVGLSMGVNGVVRLSRYDGAENLADVASVQFNRQRSYVDIGAYEFLGNSNDTTPATVVGTTPAPINSGGSVNGLSSTISVNFSNELNPIDANAPAEYELRGTGPDGVFGTADDVIYALTPDYTLGSTVVTLSFTAPGGGLPPGDYRLTIFSDAVRSIHDLQGIELDGDGNGTPGGDYVRTFMVVATPTTTVVTPGTVSVFTGQSATFTATVSSAIERPRTASSSSWSTAQPTAARLRSPAPRRSLP